MTLLQIDSNNGYKPRPDFQLRIDANGTVRYTGRYYVAVVGERMTSIGEHELQKIKLLSDRLVKRNQKNYLKKGIRAAYTVQVSGERKLHFEVDEKDVVSDDIIGQIVDLAGVRNWIKKPLDLYLVLSKPKIRSKELAVVRAVDRSHATTMFMNARSSQSFKSEEDYMALCIGHQKPGIIENPLIYFSYTGYQIQKNSPALFLNQGPPLSGEKWNVFLFVSFGKRYNDPTASYFLVVAQDISSASGIFKSTYPHFMADDFQAVDPGIIYDPIPLFETHIPVAIR